MTSIRYHIHGLVDVFIESGVYDSIVKRVDFQIGHFKEAKTSTVAPYQIRIQPYQDFSIEQGEIFETFHLVQGQTARCFHDTANRIVFLKTNTGYDIYADRPVFLINLFIQLLLIEHDISLVHAAAVADAQGNVTLFPGPGGVGKTTLIMELVGKHGYRLLGDDIVGLSKHGECFSFPRSFVLKEYHQSVYPDLFKYLGIGKTRRKEFSLKSMVVKLLWFVRENAPFVGLLKSMLSTLGFFSRITQVVPQKQQQSFFVTVPVEEIFGQESVVNRGTVSRIMFLERYSGVEFRCEPITETSLCKRMFAIIHHEWVDNMRQFFGMGAMEIIDLAAYFERVKMIIRAGISGKTCERFIIPNDTSPEDLSRHIFQSDYRRQQVHKS